MGGTGVIDRFLEVFTRYIDSGFGLLGGEVAFLATTLIVIDVTLAALFWSWGADDDILARLVKKTLFIGVFAYIIGNWNNLARIVFESFAGLGLKASGTGFSATDLLRPGRVAQVGLDAGRPILESMSGLMGYIGFFENFLQIVVLLFAWVMVLLAFFILAIQLFVTLIEFKLTTLAGFVLIPFGLFGKTAFLAERVLGNVVSSGVKVLVLAVIIGIGSTLFAEFTAGFGGAQPTIEDAMAIVLAALSLLGLGIFGPGIANGLISGGPQLGAGAAIGTGLAAGGVVAAGAAGMGMAAGAAGGALAGAARSGAALAGGASTSYGLASAGQRGAAGVAAGLGGVAKAGAGAAVQPLKRAATKAAESMRDSYRGGARGAVEATGGAFTGGASSDGASAPASSTTAASAPPAWAQRMKRSQTINHGATAAAHAVRSGDSHGGGASVNLAESDR
jgi:type IV secretion system protein TrbL